MLFNSFEFLIFIIIFFVFYWFFFKSTKHQNVLILISSYMFYGWWDWRFLSLIFLSTVIDFVVGKKIYNSKTSSKRKVYLSFSLIFNLSLLGFFKYFNFFIESWVEFIDSIGYDSNLHSLNIILPVGISFYTFQTISYSIDIYKNKLKPCNNFISFASFVSFFPQLVAGPIERATNLLPQFYRKRVFNLSFAKSGLQLIMWGLFKKVVIADNCAVYVNEIFSNYLNLSSMSLILGAVYFSFQIYCDFSGYSDIAIGISRLFGFDLMRNFNYPYFSRNISEFWRRWHISLSTWFRDYLYIPLGGSKGSLILKFRNVFLVFLISGFWHGANWTFIFWGCINAFLFFPQLIFDRNKAYLNTVAEGKKIPSFIEFFQIIITYSLVVLLWVFFRSETLLSAFTYLKNIFFGVSFYSNEYFKPVVIFPLIFFILVEWFSRENEVVVFKSRLFKYSFYFVVIELILFHSVSNSKVDFIYFQF